MPDVVKGFTSGSVRFTLSVRRVGRSSSKAAGRC
jgi:hypothetical protein